MLNAIGLATGMMLEHHTAASVAVQLRQRMTELPEIDVVEYFRHAHWEGVCVDSETGTVKCDAAAQNRTATRLLSLFGLNPAHPHAWLREACDGSVSDELVAELAAKVETVASEKACDPERLKGEIPLMLARSNGEFLSTLRNIRKLRQWVASLAG